MDIFFKFIELFKKLFNKGQKDQVPKVNKKIYTVELGRGGSESQGNFFASYEVKGLSQKLYYNDSEKDVYNHGDTVSNIAGAIFDIVQLDQNKSITDFDKPTLERAIKIHYNGDLEYKEFILRLHRI